MKSVASYAEYISELRKTFGNCDGIPEKVAVQEFIDYWSLYDDWGILVSEVIQDIRELELRRKDHNIPGRKKRISSYKQYLEKLHAEFGIPESLPESSRITAFIDEYELFFDWGITEEDVSEDLQCFIEGKYIEMLRDSAPVRKPVRRVVQKSSTLQRSTEDIPGYENIVIDRKPHISGDSTRLESTVTADHAGQDIYLVDGDNHITEGQKGIERLKKSSKVRAFFSQEGAKRKFDRKFKDRPNVSSEFVTPGDQAVDNRIKSEVGQLQKKGNPNITIVSHDTGFVKFSKKRAETKGKVVSVVKSVNEAIGKKE